MTYYFHARLGDVGGGYSDQGGAMALPPSTSISGHGSAQPGSSKGEQDQEL